MSEAYSWSDIQVNGMPGVTVEVRVTVVACVRRAEYTLFVLRGY